MPANPALRRCSSLLTAAALLALTGPRLIGATAKATDAFPSYESYIKLSGQRAAITGDAAAYESRTKDARAGIGIEDLHLSHDLDKTLSMVVDARALAGSEDYLLNVKFTKANVGTFEAGYDRFRSFYDVIGGFFPLKPAWFPLYQEGAHTDRGRFRFAAQIALPDKPVITVRYTNEARTGKKDSTIWGDSNLTGLPLLPANNATRKILPAFIDLSERHEVAELGVKHTLGKTTVELRLLGDWVNNRDQRYFIRYAGEVTPNPERRNYDLQGVQAETYSFIGTTETVFTERLTLNTGISYQHTNADFSGERPNAIGVLPTFDYKDLVGGSTAKVYTANASLGLKPIETLLVQLSLRGEDSYTKSAGSFTRVTGTAAKPVNTVYQENSRVKDQIVTPDLSVRYTGVPHFVFYGSASDRLVDGDHRTANPFTTAAPVPSGLGYDDISQNQAHYTLGANWNRSSLLTVRTEVFHKDHENKFIGYSNDIGGRYVLGYQFTGLKLTAIVKPIPQLSFTTRYQPQTGTMQVTTDSTAEFDSMHARSHLIGETIDWNPTTALYFQANANVAFNVISSAYPSSANPSQRNADNNYETYSLLSGFVLTKTTDAQIEFTYQRADNFNSSVAAYTQPYGEAYEESMITVGLKHKLTDHLMVEAKVGYLDSHNDTTGGHTDYRGPLAYVSLEYGL